MAIKRPRLKLTRGQTYTFDVSDSALATHPFKFTADSGSTEYTTGVTLTGTQGQAGALITLAVNDSAPSNLNYYCGAQGMFMGNHIVVITAAQSGGGGGGSNGGTVTLLHTLNNPDPDANSVSGQGTDAFGYSVATDGNYAIVGAYKQQIGSDVNSGKAYIYNVSDGSLAHTLNNPNAYGTGGGDRFGWAVDIDSDYAVIGAMGEDDGSGTTSGKAYIFNVSSGSLVYTLNNPAAGAAAPHGSSDDHFGYSVAIGGTHAICGAPQEYNAPSSLRAEGKAYIFSLSNGSLAYTLNNPNAYGTTDYDRFGDKVGISNTYAIVGAASEDDAGGSSSGKAYIFTLSNGNLVYTLDNPTPDANDYFGISVDVSETHAVVSAYGDDDGPGGGTVYIFDLSNGNLLHTLSNPNPDGSSSGDQFGAEVGISDTFVVVGAPGESDSSSGDSGKVYIFRISDGVLVQTLDNPNPTSSYNPFGEKVDISNTHIIEGSQYDSDGTARIFSVPSTVNWSGGVILSQLPANSGGRSTSYADDGQMATNGTYTVVGDPRMNIGTINQPGWAWIYRNSDGKEMASFNSILDGHAPNDSQLYSRNGNSGQYVASKYHKLYFGQRVAINDTYAFVTAPISYSAGESNWGNGQDGTGQGQPINAYVSVIRLSDMTHVRTIRMDQSLYSTGPSYVAGATSWGGNGIAATNDWLAIGAPHADVGTGQASGAGAIEVFNISDANPANWTSSILENVYKNSGNGNLFNFGYGIAIEGNKLASNYRSVLSAWSWNGTSWVAGSSSQSAFPNGNSDPDNLFMKNDKIYYSRTTGSPNYDAFIEARTHSGLSVLFSKQINAGNTYPGYSLMYDDSDHIFTSDAGYNDGNANAGRIMAYTLDSANHVANFDTQSLQGQGSTNNYYGSTFAVSKGWLISKETNQNPNPDVEYLTFRNYRSAILPAPFKNGGDRAFFAGGRQASPSQLLSSIQYVEMSTGANTSSFGSLNQADHWMAGNMSDKTRALFAGGTHQYPTYSNEIKYITCATTGNSSDFGDYTNGSYGMAGLSDGTKALMSGGEGLVAGNYNQNVQYVTIQTTGNSNSFGNVSMYSRRSSAVSDGTYGVFNAIGGYNYEYVTVATLGNASAFGNYYNNLNQAPAAHGNATYGLRMGGENTSGNEIATMEYITIATPGNAASWGSLATSINENTGTGNATHALSGGGNASGLGAGDQYNNINKIDMATQGNSTYFGDLMQQSYGSAGNSGNAA